MYNIYIHTHTYIYIYIFVYIYIYIYVYIYVYIYIYTWCPLKPHASHLQQRRFADSQKFDRLGRVSSYPVMNRIMSNK